MNYDDSSTNHTKIPSAEYTTSIRTHAPNHNQNHVQYNNNLHTYTHTTTNPITTTQTFANDPILRTENANVPHNVTHRILNNGHNIEVYDYNVNAPSNQLQVNFTATSEQPQSSSVLLNSIHHQNNGNGNLATSLACFPSLSNCEEVVVAENALGLKSEDPNTAVAGMMSAEVYLSNLETHHEDNTSLEFQQQQANMYRQAQISSHVSQKNERQWLDKLEELRNFHAIHGHCNVPQKYPTNPQLGTWVHKQRSQYANLQRGKPSQLSMERMRLLEATGFDFSNIKANINKKEKVPCSKEGMWQNMYEALKQYHAEKGDCLVKKRYKPNPQLGEWVCNQRKHYILLKKGMKSAMTVNRIRLLEEIGFVWDASSKVKHWCANFYLSNSVKQNSSLYFTKYNHFSVPMCEMNVVGTLCMSN